MCILCRESGISITMYADEEKEHATCYYYIKDDNYGIDGFFVADPTSDNANKEKEECYYTNMVGRILFNNDFEKFLNSDRQLTYPNDIIDISLFLKHISLLETCNFYVEDINDSLGLLYSFREKFKTKQKNIPYNVIYNAFLKMSQFGYIHCTSDSHDIIKNLLFIKELKEKITANEPIDGLVESFVKLTGKIK